MADMLKDQKKDVAAFEKESKSANGTDVDQDSPSLYPAPLRNRINTQANLAKVWLIGSVNSPTARTADDSTGNPSTIPSHSRRWRYM